MDVKTAAKQKFHIFSCSAENILQALEREYARGGRMEMVYAHPRKGALLELRYLVNHAEASQFAIITCEATGPVPSMTRRFPLLGWYEREIADLYGVDFADHPQPYSLIRQEPEAADSPSLQSPDIQILPFGPIRADVVESAEFTFYYAGESIIHYHPRLFFKHRGMERRFEGLTPQTGVIFAERVSGIGSLAHALAYSLACEQAAGCTVPVRAQQLRALLAELERIYNHLAYLGYLADTTTLKVGQAEGKLLAERAKQINGRLTGSRFLRGIVTPGGLRRDIMVEAWVEVDLAALREEAEWYVRLLNEDNTFRDRLITTGHLDDNTAYDQGATGPVARASGVNRELRRDHPYAGYAGLAIPVPVRTEGDADARFHVRVAELFTSFDLIAALLRDLTDGPIAVPCMPGPGAAGLGWAESPRGALFYAVHLDAAGRFERVKIKSPSFSNWRVFPYTVHNSNMMDYAINEASFGLSIAGCDR